MGEGERGHIVQQISWLDDIPDEEWALYRQVIGEARARGLDFALGGAFATATYTGQWRNTKDLDFFILPEQRDAFVDLLADLGMHDFYDELEYDRGWIYRGSRDGLIVDVIWQMANRRAEVDKLWLSRGPQVDVRGERVHVLPAEEVIWAKLYIMHRDRCDWMDVFNLFYAAGPSLDWEHLLRRVAEDRALLTGALSVFTWLCPGRAGMLPDWIWERVDLPIPQPGATPDADRRRADFLDSRPWLAPVLDDDEELVA